MNLKFTPLIALVLLITACKNDNTKSNETTTNSEPVSEVSGSMYDHPKFTEKYNDYIAFQNYFHNSLMKNLDGYYRKFDPAKPLNKNNRPIIWSHSVSPHSDRLLKNSNAAPNFGTIDEVSKTLAKRSKSVDSLLALSGFYYSKKTNETDNYAEGQRLSNQVEPALKAYYETYASFKNQMDVLAYELTLRDLKRLKESKQMVRYNMLATVNEADKLAAYIYDNSEANFKSIDISKLEELQTKLNEPLTDLEKLSLDTEAVKKELGFHSSSLPSFIRHTSYLIRVIGDLQERIKTNNWKYQITHPTIPDDGSLEKISKVYSDMITSYNRTM